MISFVAEIKNNILNIWFSISDNLNFIFYFDITDLKIKADQFLYNINF